jgi:hypothetical protein
LRQIAQCFPLLSAVWDLFVRPGYADGENAERCT